MKPRKLFKSEERRYFDLYSCLKDIQYMCVYVCLSFLLLKHFAIVTNFFVNFIQLEFSLMFCNS